MKILLVDDSGTMRQIQKMILQGIGLADIVEAADGAQAIRIATEQRPALILMDWNMPGMKGIEALRKLKAADITKAIPVIMVTSESEKSHVLEAVRAGAANYMVKPISAEVVKEKLAPYLIHYGVHPVTNADASAPANGKGPEETAKSGQASEPEIKPAPPK